MLNIFKMKDCLTTTIVFTMANLFQIGIVIKLFFLNSLCHITCLVLMSAGSTILPCFITIHHIIYSQLNKIYKLWFISILLAIPFFSSVGARISLQYCFDENWRMLVLQGLNLPIIYWTFYRIIFDKPILHDIITDG